jgi:hypothetical protein
VRIPPREVPGAGTAAIELDIRGSGYFGTAFGPLVRVDGKDVLAVVLDAAQPDCRIQAFAGTVPSGKRRIDVVNPDGQSATALVEF